MVHTLVNNLCVWCVVSGMLDTNIVIYMIKRRPVEVLAVFNHHAGQMCISSITLAELMQLLCVMSG